MMLDHAVIVAIHLQCFMWLVGGWTWSAIRTSKSSICSQPTVIFQKDHFYLSGNNRRFSHLNSLKGGKLVSEFDRSYDTSISRLVKNDVVEFVAGGQIKVGNALKGNKSTILVILPTNETVTIDCGQIISIWKEQSQNFPNLYWPDVIHNATMLLNEMTPDDSNLEEFWKLCYQRSPSTPIDSVDLAIYLFQRKKFYHWLQSNLHGMESTVFIPTPVERYVAALMLFNNQMYVKRRMSVCVYPEDHTDDALHYYEIADKHLGRPATIHFIRPGGYHLCHPSNVNQCYATMFADYVDNNGERRHADGKIKVGLLDEAVLFKIVQELQSFSQTGCCSNGIIKSIVRRLGEPYSIEGVTNLLNKVKLKVGSSGKNLSSTDVTPWTSEVIDASKSLVAQICAHRRQLKSVQATRTTVRQQGANVHHPISIDVKGSSLFDDALSFSPETNELLIHITDAYRFLSAHPTLLRVAQKRKQSVFTPSGTLHMLPPSVLKALCLSRDDNNEVLTVALMLDFSTGNVVNSRIFPSTIGPVVSVDIQTVNEILVGADLNPSIGNRYPPCVVHDLQDLCIIAERLCDANPWLDYKFNPQRLNNINQKHHGAFRAINTFLTMYSMHSYQFCLDKGVSVPIAWNNRDFFEPSRIRRFASSPVRNYISIVQQQQLKAALGLNEALSKQECAAVVRSYQS